MSRLLHRSVRSNNLQDAEQVIGLMKQKNIKPMKEDIEIMIKGFAHQYNQEKVAHYIHLLLRSGYKLEINLINAIMRIYIDRNALQQAASVFHQALSLHLRPSLESCKILMTAFFRARQYEALLSIPPIMYEYEIKMDQQISETILASLMSTQKSLEIIQHLNEVHAARVFVTPKTRLQILKYFVQRDLLSEAEKLHNSFFSSSALSCTAIIRGYLNCNRIEDANAMYLHMRKHKLLMSSEMCAGFLRYYIDQEKPQEAFLFFNDVPKNFKDAPGLFLEIMQSLQLNGFHAQVPDMLHRFLKQFKMPEIPKMYNIQIDMELNVFNEDRARKLLADMKENKVEPTVDTYNLFFNWWTTKEAPDTYWPRIEEMWEEMRENQIQPNLKTFEYLIRYALNNDNEPIANKWFVKLVNEHPDVVPYRCYQMMIEYYSKSKPEFATMLLKRLVSFLEKDRSRDLYHSIMAGFVSFKDVMSAGKYYDAMIGNRIHPNQQTYNILIRGYSYYSFLSEATRQLELMKEKTIEPNRETYNSLIFCCAKVGDIAKAKKYFFKLESIKVPPNEETYHHIIAGYYRMGAPEKAEHFAKEVKIEYSKSTLASRTYFEQ